MIEKMSSFPFLPKNWTFILPLCASICLLETACALDFLTTYQKAKRQSPQYLSAEAEVQAVEARHSYARGELLPQSNLSLNTFDNRQTVSDSALVPSGTTHFNSHGYRLEIKQPLFRLDAWLLLKQAEKEVQKVAFELKKTEQNILIGSVEAYGNALIALHQLMFSNGEHDATKRYFEQASARFEAGVSTKTDLEEAKARLDRSQVQQKSAEWELHKQLQAIKELTGELPTQDELQLLNLEMPLREPEPFDVGALLEIALKENPSLQVALFAQSSAQLEIQHKKSLHLPTLHLKGSLDNQKGGSGLLGQFQTQTESIGLELNVPLLQGGQVLAKTSEAGHDYEKASHQVEQVRRQIERQLTETHEGVLYTISQIQALRQAELSAHTAFQTTQAGFLVGTRTMTELLDSQTTWHRTQKDLKDHYVQYAQYFLRMKAIQGVLSEEDLRYFDTWLVSHPT